MFRKLNHLTAPSNFTVKCLRLQIVEQHVLRDERLAVKFSSMNPWSSNFCRGPVQGGGGSYRDTPPGYASEKHLTNKTLFIIFIPN